MFTNEKKNMGFPECAWVEKTVIGEEKHWFFDKEKVPDATVSKEGHADRFFFNVKGFIAIIFLKKVQN